MKRKVYIIFFICLSFSLGILCTIGFLHWEYNSGYTTELELFRSYQHGGMNSPSYSISELTNKIINKGVKEDYNELKIYYLDIGFYKVFPWALLMANKFDYDQAYFDVFYSLYDLNNNVKCEYENSENYSLDNLDTKTQKIAIDYLIMATNKGHEQAEEILTIYKKEGKYINK